MPKSKTPHTDCCTSKHPVDAERRRFLSASMRVLGCVGAACALIPLASSLKPSRRVLAANGPIDVDLSTLQPGQQMTIVWRGKPIWIIRRTPQMIAELRQKNPELRDPKSLVPQQPRFAQNAWRSLQPEYLVLVGVCTHLGCTPEYKTKDPRFVKDNGGFYCPCHGSRFDLAGRVYRHVPAPINMEVPPYRFVNDHVIRLGETA
ncbi:MAG: ubiquinol-cytochrome c reductase iron-sulfur subunit [Gammaproteobacteria bacterium]|nr:ubiquinol-cytochrome c reductase iron-sulfur subunit [Gammaproteobacteria bacterium]